MNLAHLSIARVGHRKVPRVLTNEERMRAYRAIAPVQFANTTFTPARLSELPPSRAGGAGTYNPDPPTPEEVAEAARFKFGAL